MQLLLLLFPNRSYGCFILTICFTIMYTFLFCLKINLDIYSIFIWVTIHSNMALPAKFMGCWRKPTNTLMNLVTLAKSANPLTSGSRISEIIPLHCMLGLNWSLVLLPHLGLYLNLSPPCDILKLKEGTIELGKHKLSNINLEHAQVSRHMDLLRSSKPRT